MLFRNSIQSVLRRSLFIIPMSLAISACSPPSEESPVVFLPKVKNPLGAQAEELRRLFCSPEKVSFRDGVLTDANIRNIFQCANYDNSLDGLRGIIQNPEFPQFIEHVNALISAEATVDIGKILRDWLEPGASGKSKVDELLPVLSSVIKNAIFQEALPLVHNILRDGEDIWREVLPSVADLIYTDRFPHTFDDLLTLFSTASSAKAADSGKEDYAKRIKFWAKFLVAPLNGKTVTAHVLELLDEAHKLELPNTTLPEYLDQMNVKGVFISMYLESGALRGEQISPKLNADPDKDEQESGVILTPEERRRKAHRALFAGGGAAPIAQLAGMVQEFNKPHPNFLPSLGRWFSGNGDKLSSGLFEYVANALIRVAIPKVNLENYLLSAAEKKFGGTSKRIQSAEFVAFLKEALSSPDYSSWLEEYLHRTNKEQFGAKNAKLFARSSLKRNIWDLYQMTEVAEFGAVIVPASRPLPIASAIKRFSNLHRSDKLLVKVGEKSASLEVHMSDIWLGLSQDSMGESIVINFGLKLVQTMFTEFTNGFGDKKTTLAKWYYQSAYGDPSGTEAVAGYLFKDLSLLDVWRRNKDYLKNEFAPEVFVDPDDLRAFRTLVDQVPNIWLYIRSGMMRSGSDLTRNLAERDTGYLIQNYVDLVSTVTENGMLARAVPIIESYLRLEAQEGLVRERELVVDQLADRRRIARGTDALRRVMEALLEPEVEGDYKTTIGHKLLKPFAAMVKEDRRASTEKFMMKVSEEIMKTPDDTLNRLFREMNSTKEARSRVTERSTLRALADLLRHEKFPEVVGSLRRFFDDKAVKPALDFLANKIDDGTLDRVLLFVRRVLGLKGTL